MPIQFISVGTYATPGQSTTIAVPSPAGPFLSNDFLVVAIENDKFTGTVSPPDSTWHAVGPNNNSGNNAGLSIFYKFSSGTEPGSYTFTFSANLFRAGLSLQYRAVSNFEALATAAATASLSLATPVVTPLNTGDLLLTISSAENDAIPGPTITADNRLSVRANYTSSTSGFAIMAADILAPGIGIPSPQYTNTCTGTANVSMCTSVSMLLIQALNVTVASIIMEGF